MLYRSLNLGNASNMEDNIINYSLVLERFLFNMQGMSPYPFVLKVTDSNEWMIVLNGAFFLNDSFLICKVCFRLLKVETDCNEWMTAFFLKDYLHLDIHLTFSSRHAIAANNWSEAKAEKAIKIKTPSRWQIAKWQSSNFLTSILLIAEPNQCESTT